MFKQVLVTVKFSHKENSILWYIFWGLLRFSMVLLFSLIQDFEQALVLKTKYQTGVSDFFNINQFKK